MADVEDLTWSNSLYYNSHMEYNDMKGESFHDILIETEIKLYNHT